MPFQSTVCQDRIPVLAYWLPQTENIVYVCWELSLCTCVGFAVVKYTMNCCHPLFPPVLYNCRKQSSSPSEPEPINPELQTFSLQHLRNTGNMSSLYIYKRWFQLKRSFPQGVSITHSAWGPLGTPPKPQDFRSATAVYRDGGRREENRKVEG